MVYGAFAALAQTDFKRLVAYSSVSHMGYVRAGHRRVERRRPATNYNPDYWKMGMNGAMFQMIAHGISSAGMFFMVGVIYDRVHHRNLERVRRPVRQDAGLQRPGDRHFLRRPGPARACAASSAKCSSCSRCGTTATALAVISAAVVILTAGYILWAIQRVYLGAEYKGPHREALTPMTPRELAIAAPLLALAIFFGVYPQALLNYMQPSVDQTVVELADWTKTNEPAKLQSQAGAAQRGQATSRQTNSPQRTQRPQRSRSSTRNLSLRDLCVLCGESYRTHSG